MTRARARTPKQILLSHIRNDHRREPAKSMTFKELGEWHSAQHHRFRTSHRHEGVNNGADQRPPGWKTGEGAVTRTESFGNA